MSKIDGAPMWFFYGTTDVFDASIEENLNWTVRYKQAIRGEEKPHHSDGEILYRQFAINLHRIDKDVERCDRNLIFFSNKENLESLRGTHTRMLYGADDKIKDNFPQRSGMDVCLMNLRSLIQKAEHFRKPFSFELNGGCRPANLHAFDFTSIYHLYFSYRWFLLDFKREMSTMHFRVWETIWAAKKTFTPHFSLFFALAMVTNYRDVIIANNMDFTDMIKFSMVLAIIVRF
ncbi:hypothetical protein COOONC_18614 [Cooperia oncophora]